MKTTFSVTEGNGLNCSRKEFTNEIEAREYYNVTIEELARFHKPLKEKYDVSKWSENDEALKESRLYRVELTRIDIDDDGDAMEHDTLEVTEDYEWSDIM